MQSSYIEWYDDLDNLCSAMCDLYFYDNSDNRGEHWELDDVVDIRDVCMNDKPLEDWDVESIKTFIMAEVNNNMERYMKEGE